MSSVASIYQRSPGDVRAFARGYVEQLAITLSALDFDAVMRCIDRLDRARREERTVFVIGNGGSASTASHMANDLLSLTNKCGNVSPAFRIVALTDNMALFSAIANDDGYEHVFVRQLATLFRSGDMLISISASGNSPNLLEAARWVRANAGTNIGLLGFDGGALLKLCDDAIVVRTVQGEYGFVEDAHLVMDHLMTNWFQQHLQSATGA